MEELTQWFHKMFGEGCIHPPNSSPQCVTWAREFISTNPTVLTHEEQSNVVFHLNKFAQRLANQDRTDNVQIHSVYLKLKNAAFKISKQPNTTSK